MCRSALILILLAASAAPVLAGGSTIQIEPRPTYGATVTIEEGVRVFRPLPGPRHVIVNPNRTPLFLDVSEHTTINQVNSSSNVVVKRRGY